MSQVNSTILVIGASGFLGRHVAQALLADGRTVRCMARDTTRVQDLADAGCEVVQGDILDAASVEHALESVQAAYICIHTLSPQGANSSGQDFMGVEKTGLQNIVRACETHGVRRLIYVTSIGIAPDAPSAWLRGRWQTEQFLFNSGRRPDDRPDDRHCRGISRPAPSSQDPCPAYGARSVRAADRTGEQNASRFLQGLSGQPAG